MNRENIWDITKRPHTQIKLRILRKYLDAWTIIIGSYFPKAYFIDAFAGRGKYHYGNQKDSIAGSPIIGLEISLDVRKKKQKKGKKFDLNIISIESDKDNVSDLRRFFREIDPKHETKIELYESEFESAIPKILKKISNAPAFFFIDPYGIKGVDRDALDLIINRSGSTEIFLNYMNMGVQRIKGQLKNIDHEDEKIRIKAIKTISHLTKLVGDTSWIGKNERELLKHFVSQVLSKNYKFVLNFNVPYPGRSGTMYNLLFATKYDAGERIMKHIMTKELLKGTLFEDRPFNIDWNIK